MCGINGVIHKDESKIAESSFERMRDSMEHRGPDDKGAFYNNNVALGHRRLSILDTSINGHQPFVSPDGRYTIVFNGNIYNFKTFKLGLQQKGYKFRSETDTEVLLYLYIEYGAKALNRLNGIFAFAIWDKENQEMFIARDRVGVKPLYYTKQSKYFAFASEPKALFAYGLPKTMAEENLNEWLFFRFIAGDKSLFKDVEKLLPGHYMVLNKSNGYNPEIKRWWKLSDEINKHPEINDPEDWFKNTFYASIQDRMVSDVPVGILLSGGVDSSSVAAAVKNNNFNDIHTFNIGFPGFIDDESQIARATSKRLGFPYHSVEIKGKELEDAYVHATYFHDKPLIHQNDPHILTIARHAKQHVSVLLSGEGADELLGGYVRYKPLAYNSLMDFMKVLFSYIPENFLTNRFKKLKSFYSIANSKDACMWNSSNIYPTDFMRYGLEYAGIPNPYRMNILEEGAELFGNNTLRQVLYLDQHTYLCSLNQRNDNMCMAAAIECREPFMDYRIMAGLGTLDNNWFINNKGVGKYLLRKTMKPYIGDDIVRSRKIGLSIPWAETLKSSPLLSDLWKNMANHEGLKIGILGKLNIKKIKQDCNSGNKSAENLLRHLLMYLLWYDTYLKNPN